MNRHPISYLNNGIRTHKNNALFANTPVNSLIDIFLDHHHPFIIVLATLWISFPRIIRRKFPLSVRYGAHSWIPSQTKRDVRAWIYHNIAENVWMELLLNALVSFSKMCRGDLFGCHPLPKSGVWYGVLSLYLWCRTETQCHLVGQCHSNPWQIPSGHAPSWFVAVHRHTDSF